MYIYIYIYICIHTYQKPQHRTVEFLQAAGIQRFEFTYTPEDHSADNCRYLYKSLSLSTYIRIYQIYIYILCCTWKNSYLKNSVSHTPHIPLTCPHIPSHTPSHALLTCLLTCPQRNSFRYNIVIYVIDTALGLREIWNTQLAKATEYQCKMARPLHDACVEFVGQAE